MNSNKESDGRISKFLVVSVEDNWYLMLVRAECVRQRNEVAIKLGIIFPLLLPPLSRHLLNLQERVVVGFPNFAWAPKKK
jgi:hypothetical protein